MEECMRSLAILAVTSVSAVLIGCSSAGSPGMELPSGEVEAYDVHLVVRDGSTAVFAHHGDRTDLPDAKAEDGNSPAPL
jgi:hypothetical protein